MGCNDHDICSPALQFSPQPAAAAQARRDAAGAGWPILMLPLDQQEPWRCGKIASSVCLGPELAGSATH